MSQYTTFRLRTLGCLAVLQIFISGCRAVPPEIDPNIAAPAAPVKTGRFEQEIEGFKTPVLAFVPEDYDPDKSYGLVVFLHGTGMTGPQMVRKTPVGKFNEAGYILLAPTSNYTRWGVNEGIVVDARKLELTHLRNMIEYFESTYNIDENCVHTVGFSIGTILLAHGIGYFGEWDGMEIRSLLGFSGGFEGEVIPAKASRKDKTAIWVLNGEKDRGHTRGYKNIYRAFKEAGYDTRISEPRGLGHEFPLIPFETMIDWWRELDGDRIDHYSPELALRQGKKQAVMVMREKKFDEAQAMFEDLLKQAPQDPQILYNLACLHSMTGNQDLALGYLDQAIEHGFRNFAHIQADSDLTALRELEAYDQLIKKYQP